MTEVKYTPGVMSELLETFKLIDGMIKQASQQHAKLVTLALGTEIALCSECHRPMIPRRVWDSLSVDERPSWAARGGSEGKCHPHYIRSQKDKGVQPRGKILSAEEAARLRQRNKDWYLNQRRNAG